MSTLDRLVVAIATRASERLEAGDERALTEMTVPRSMFDELLSEMKCRPPIMLYGVLIRPIGAP